MGHARALETLSASPLFAARVQGVAFLLDSDQVQSHQHPDYALINKLVGFRNLKRAVKRMLERLWQAISPGVDFRFCYGPS